jgi:hypothetical protein
MGKGQVAAALSNFKSLAVKKETRRFAPFCTHLFSWRKARDKHRESTHNEMGFFRMQAIFGPPIAARIYTYGLSIGNPGIACGCCAVLPAC